MKKDLLTLQDLTKSEILAVIARAIEIKKASRNSNRSLVGYTLGLIFDKASTRTRISFETAMFHLGGQTLFLTPGDTQISRNEPIKDTARVLSRYLDILAVRTYSQDMVEEMAHWADIPVINALTDQYHPCQILSDLMTVKEKKGDLDKVKIAWIGDGNNVAHSWINAARIVGFDLALACPSGYHPDPKVMAGAGKNITLQEDPLMAVHDVDIINTDVWTSMGQDEEQTQRVSDFQGFQINQSLLKSAKPDALVMHCLPAHRGEEITDEVLEGPHSVVFDQTENKMHLHKALLETMLLPR
ncbi:MAG: ornithine carbamoyltransferase [Desulfatiglans sp.]|jgi:ornithine carbamoyltransferase|nr:ornithine carbamoyltransferase [Thermodesulfobacteriota bacterium]MEE4352091.1 ornithine carbamoyltransferase [Desulfatiglans sp.]